MCRETAYKLIGFTAWRFLLRELNCRATFILDIICFSEAADCSKMLVDGRRLLP